MPFKQMENIAAYLEACTKLGVPAYDSFQTVALYENKDMIAVLTNIHSLGRVAQRVEGFTGPSLGAKLADTNKREFDEEQLRAAKAAPTLIGKGSHGGATQAGMIDYSKNINRGASIVGIDGLGQGGEATMATTGAHGLVDHSGMIDRNREIVRPQGQ
mmetsp:Transcript_5393/g.9042  ORF Transcript_5393/g.9042 Transcript_5393/m.9042 type:complete len:158 (-) Transcript_5393:241-714(-)